MTKHKIFAVIIFFFATAQVWADADTLRPVGDRAYTDWTVHPSGDHWNAYDDTTTNEDTNYVYATDDPYDEGWYHSDWSGSGTIDSVRLVVRAKSDIVDNKIYIARIEYTAEGSWVVCCFGDTFEMTDSYDNYWVTWSIEPCWEMSWTSELLNNEERAWSFHSWTPTMISDTLHIAVSEDAWMSHDDGTSNSWTVAHDAATCNSFNATATDIRAGTWAEPPESKTYFRRAPFIVNTSDLPDDAILDSARFYIYNEVFIDSVSPNEPTIHIVGFTSGGSIDAGDFGSFGTTSWGSKNFSGEGVSEWNYISFNATGLAEISKIGNTEFGFREYYDMADDSAGANGHNRAIRFHGESGNIAYLKIYYRYPTPTYEDRVTQSFVVVYYTPSAEERNDAVLLRQQRK